ncbi:MAG: hypothetical protein KJN88_06290, partial [Gammaproteobacteria bacterium]|nr:hypothetical protein [Gammaproteobacteria bacterium]
MPTKHRQARNRALLTTLTLTLLLAATASHADTVRDEFTTVSFGGNNGTDTWSADWQEVGEADGAGAGAVRVVSNGFTWAGNALRVDLGGSFAAIREANLLGASGVTLTYDYRQSVGDADSGQLQLQVSDDGGSTWTPLRTYTFAAEDPGPVSESIDITAYAASDTQIAFIVTEVEILNQFFVDDVQIEYTPANLCPGWTVTTTVDALVSGSLRSCVIAANGNPGDDTITLPAGTYALTLTGAGENNSLTGDLDVDDPGTSLTINGAGARTTIIDAAALGDRIFEINSGDGDLTLTGMTLQNGDAGSDDGGAITSISNILTLTDVALLNNSADQGGAVNITSGTSTLNADRVLMSGNTAREGGAVYGSGGGILINITNGTFNGNTGTSQGGAFHINHLALVNVTVSDNTAPATEGGGVFKGGGENFSAINTIIAGNTGDDCVDTIDSGNNNIDSDSTCGFATTANPLLGALANNGGPTDTMFPQSGSPAIEGGTNTLCPAVDQRSQSRPQGFVCDVGAVEAVLTELSGTVFEDANFAGTASDYDGGTSDLALPNVDVELYTSADVYVGSTTTDASGNYSFGVVDGTYKVRVR